LILPHERDITIAIKGNVFLKKSSATGAALMIAKRIVYPRHMDETVKTMVENIDQAFD
jgi:hypothetical protein